MFVDRDDMVYLPRALTDSKILPSHFRLEFGFEMRFEFLAAASE